MAVGDPVPYGIKIAPIQGGITKAVTKIMIAPEQGPINKLISYIWIAPEQGPINKRVFIGGGLYGDVDNDGVIDITDSTSIRWHYEGIELLNLEQQHRADVNKDGAVTSADKALVDAYILEHM